MLFVGGWDDDFEGLWCPCADTRAEVLKLDCRQVGGGSGASKLSPLVPLHSLLGREEVGFEYVVHLFGGEACLIGEDLDYYSMIVGVLCESAESVLGLECDFDRLAFVSR